MPFAADESPPDTENCTDSLYSRSPESLVCGSQRNHRAGAQALCNGLSVAFDGSEKKPHCAVDPATASWDLMECAMKLCAAAGCGWGEFLYTGSSGSCLPVVEDGKSLLVRAELPVTASCHGPPPPAELFEPGSLLFKAIGKMMECQTTLGAECPALASMMAEAASNPDADGYPATEEEFNAICGDACPR